MSSDSDLLCIMYQDNLAKVSHGIRRHSQARQLAVCFTSLSDRFVS